MCVGKSACVMRVWSVSLSSSRVARTCTQLSSVPLCLGRRVTLYPNTQCQYLPTRYIFTILNCTKYSTVSTLFPNILTLNTALFKLFFWSNRCRSNHNNDTFDTSYNLQYL